MYKNDMWKTNLANAVRVTTKLGKAPLTRRLARMARKRADYYTAIDAWWCLKSINPNGWSQEATVALREARAAVERCQTVFVYELEGEL